MIQTHLSRPRLGLFSLNFPHNLALSRFDVQEYTSNWNWFNHSWIRLPIGFVGLVDD